MQKQKLSLHLDCWVESYLLYLSQQLQMEQLTVDMEMVTMEEEDMDIVEAAIMEEEDIMGEEDIMVVVDTMETKVMDIMEDKSQLDMVHQVVDMEHL